MAARPSTNVIHVNFADRKKALGTPARGKRGVIAPSAPPVETFDAHEQAHEPQALEKRQAREARRAIAPAPQPPPEVPSRTLQEVQTKKRDPTGDLFSRAEVSRLFSIPESRLRYWDKTGFMAPSGEANGKQLYTFQDLIGVRTAKALLERGTPLRRVRASVESLKNSLPHVIRPLAELRISADGEQLVVHTERAKWEPTSGQLVLDFDVRDLRDEVVRVLRPDATDPARRRAAYEAYLEGARLDEEPTTYDRAEAAYQRAIQLDPTLGHALTNLGNLRFRRGDAAQSESLYRRALAIDPDQPEAFYNLGYIASERGEHAEARRCFEAAVKSDPAFADAHFNLASTLEALKESKAARAHWQIYLELEPKGDWAEIARRFLKSK